MGSGAIAVSADFGEQETAMQKYLKEGEKGPFL